MAVPDGLGERGRALWATLGQTSESSASGVVAVEACRTADRLDRLHDSLSGGGEWLQVIIGNDEVSLMIDKALVEVRLQALALKTLLESPVLKVSEGKADPLDEFARARAARLAAAKGSHGA